MSWRQKGDPHLSWCQASYPWVPAHRVCPPMSSAAPWCLWLRPCAQNLTSAQDPATGLHATPLPHPLLSGPVPTWIVKSSQSHPFGFPSAFALQSPWAVLQVDSTQATLCVATRGGGGNGTRVPRDRIPPERHKGRPPPPKRRKGSVFVFTVWMCQSCRADPTCAYLISPNREPLSLFPFYR